MQGTVGFTTFTTWLIWVCAPRRAPDFTTFTTLTRALAVNDRNQELEIWRQETQGGTPPAYPPGVSQGKIPRHMQGTVGFTTFTTWPFWVCAPRRAPDFTTVTTLPRALIPGGVGGGSGMVLGWFQGVLGG